MTTHSLLAARLREHRRRALDHAPATEHLVSDLALAAAIVDSDFERGPQAAHSANLVIARRLGAGHVLRTLCVALDMGGVTASKLAEMLGYPIADLHGEGLQAVANMVTTAAEEEAKAGPEDPPEPGELEATDRFFRALAKRKTNADL